LVYNITTMLKKRRSYIQIALNSSLEEAGTIISRLPRNNRILIEAGTPLIKQYGSEGIRFIKQTYKNHLLGLSIMEPMTKPNNLGDLNKLLKMLIKPQKPPDDFQREVSGSEEEGEDLYPYVVADLKTMDRGKTEVRLAAEAGADAAIALGHAPIETLESFVKNCAELGLDSMIDMMNVENPITTLRVMRNKPTVVILHRGVDETEFNREKQIPYHDIQRIKGSLDILVAVAGGDTPREVQRAIFNDADIVIVWKEFLHSNQETTDLAYEFLKQIK